MNSTLNQLKMLRRSNYVRGEHTEMYDRMVRDIEKILDEDDDRAANVLLSESLKKEMSNNEKSEWYNEHFDNWIPLPDRYDCEGYHMSERLRYSQFRIDVFNHMEMKFKMSVFPNVARRIEFF